MMMPDMVGIDASRQPVVAVKDGEVFADSRAVAASFDKRHDAVLRDIRNLVGKAPSLGLHNFVAFKVKDLTGESTSHYEMDRRGFTLLAMGFTGDKALQWKLRYIDAFEAMEAELRRRSAVPTDFSSPHVLLGCLQALQAQCEAQGEQIRTLAPKADRLDRIADSTGAYTKETAAKNLGIGSHEFGRQLRAMKWMRRNAWGHDVANQPYLTKGLLLQRTVDWIDAASGVRRSAPQVFVTPKGLALLTDLLPRAERRA